MLLLDPTDVEVTLSMVSFYDESSGERNYIEIFLVLQVFELGLLPPDKQTVIVTLSDFADDASDLVRSEAVAKIKTAAEMGHTVLLTNAAPISSSIFDLLNKHYTSIPKIDAAGAVFNLYYANIAIGSFSRPCPVKKEFRIVVHLPMSAVPSTPLPFLNRFEKYTLSLAVSIFRISLLLV